MRKQISLHDPKWIALAFGIVAGAACGGTGVFIQVPEQDTDGANSTAVVDATTAESSSSSGSVPSDEAGAEGGDDMAASGDGSSGTSGSSGGSTSSSGGSSSSSGTGSSSTSSSSGSSSSSGGSGGPDSGVGAVDGESDARVEAGDSGPTSDAGDASPGDGAGPLSFATSVYPIITARCIACHTPPMGSGFLNGHLDMTTNGAAGAYNQLLMRAMGVVAGGAATTCLASGLTRVVPGSAATSLLFNKVDSKLLGMPALCGNPMPNPAAAPPLTAQQVTTIRDWIDQGANP